MAGRLGCCFVVGERARRTKEFFIAQSACNEAALGRCFAEGKAGPLPASAEQVVQPQFTRSVFERCGNQKPSQVAGDLCAHWNCGRPEFEVDGADDASVPLEVQFHMGKRQMGRTQYNPISLSDIKPSASES